MKIRGKPKEVESMEEEKEVAGGGKRVEGRGSRGGERVEGGGGVEGRREPGRVERVDGGEKWKTEDHEGNNEWKEKDQEEEDCDDRDDNIQIEMTRQQIKAFFAATGRGEGGIEQEELGQIT